MTEGNYLGGTQLRPYLGGVIKDTIMNIGVE